MSHAYTVTPENLLQFGADVLAETGVPAGDAHLLADSLVTAELWGHSSHGMLRLPWYVERLRSGAMTPVTSSVLAVDQGAVVVMDGYHGIGQVLTSQATTIGIERARKYGVSAVGVRNSNHFGTAAYFTRQAAQAGCVALLATNASPAMAPWGGRAKAIGTNPWSIAAPAGSRGVAVMDIANTAVARGKIYLAAERGEAIPEGWAANADGVPTSDAQEAIHGLILPMAGHKGYIISFMMDVLAGVLTGSNFGAQVAGPYESKRQSGCGHMLITIDIGAMMPLAQFEERMATLIADIKNVPLAAGVEQIFFPGELEDIHAAQHRTAGIDITSHTWQSLSRLADETGLALPNIVNQH
ncbi:Ldh family oxidoreductase [Janthinobacterium sp.]|uniref:Ldh family oxidoreductase n=1 Tax=Janthinobacterium sp. TaxID=1871054 RepID=UPI002631C4D4|nr:Ldh family oxidoreductase [Janthinobacterium sp.]